MDAEELGDHNIPEAVKRILYDECNVLMEWHLVRSRVPMYKSGFGLKVFDGRAGRRHYTLAGCWIITTGKDRWTDVNPVLTRQPGDDGAKASREYYRPIVGTWIN